MILPAEQEQRWFPKRLRQLVDREGKGALQTILECATLLGIFEERAQGVHPAEARLILHYQQRFSDGSGPFVRGFRDTGASPRRGPGDDIGAGSGICARGGAA